MNTGFTLIELVVVIAIVAITTAMVLPRVWAWQRAARIGNLQYVRGAVHSSAILVHAAMLARGGRPDAAPCPAGGDIADNTIDGPGTLCTEGGLVHTMHGYPASADEQLGRQGYDVTVAGAVTTIARADAPQPAECSFTYTAPLVARTAASISPALVSGC